MTTTRTDIHRPSAPEFDPAGYDCLGVFDLRPDPEDPATGYEVARLHRAVNAALARGASFHGAPHGSEQCSHCGAYIRYGALMEHTPTKTLLYIGETCLDERFAYGTRADFAALRAATAAKAKETRERNRRHEIAAEVLAWLDGQDERLAELTYVGNGGLVDTSDFLYDVSRKMFRYGELTDRQAEAVETAVARDAAYNGRREEQARFDAARRESGVTAPEGRTEVTGAIAHTWIKDSVYGAQYKMRVQTDAGYIVITTIPSALLSDESGYSVTLESLRGRRVAFTATLSRADDDQTLAFAKRPTKARTL